MNREELIEAVASDAGLSKAGAKSAIAAMIDNIQKAVSTGDKVVLTGFCTFEALKTAERQGSNPQTGQMVTIPAGVRPKFTPGKAFKDAVNHSHQSF